MDYGRKIKVLGIACSPRIRGNTALLLKEALAGAEDYEAEVELLQLRSLEFNPCIACNACFKTGHCIYKDGMHEIYEKLLEADRLILAAPIFSMGICAQAKMMIDRCQPFWATQNILKKAVIDNKEDRPQRKGIFLSTAGTPFTKPFEEAQRIAKYLFKVIETDFVGSYCYNNLDEAGAVLNHPSALTEVFKAGQQLAIR